ncbi:MAG: MBL fold metallo-hydrolase [Prevotella sp.]|jgi:glyoxylase-like metal-dependent hydrolase (beta-lactamase superfamily II)|nr:MBL fold metallo-hydrolase [Prevotella sp.]
MFHIKKLVCNPLEENCYVVSDETKECVIIDCGAYYPEEFDALEAYLRDQQLKPVHLLATHGHLDHNFGNVRLFHAYGLKVEICGEDQQLVEQLPEQAKNLFGMTISEECPQVGRLLKDGDEITFGSHTLCVLHTPGHSHGSCLYYCAEEKTVFTGDTLFRMSIGRTDFAEGSWAEMEQSLKNVVAKLPKETTVLAGHGPQSTIADELQYNPYLR